MTTIGIPLFPSASCVLLRRGALSSGPELVTAIDACIAHHDIDPTTPIWTMSGRDIVQRVIRAITRVSSRQNETLHQPETQRRAVTRRH